MVVYEQVDARRATLGRREALALAAEASRVVVAKGRQVVDFDMKKSRPDDETLLGNLLGPTGNLRAPAIRVGKTLLVGFNEEVYAEHLG